MMHGTTAGIFLEKILGFSDELPKKPDL